MVLGVVGVIPFVMAAYAVEQLVLAPLGLAPVDSTNNDGNAGVVLVGVVAPLVVVAVWAVVTATVIRTRRLSPRTWIWAGATLAAPTLAFLVAKLS